ncbi:MAG: hypothetical protein WBI34_02585 [Tenuifilaceae bacterium]|jgi:hypothetical protein|nr:hypothetical protein [Bacteroidales bacterium]MDI9517291.1 hypothetical protein [Bacteroidota bacterium]NLH56893.1 hypothetical protein [Rikenellaceae bacterium]OQC62797.1 MAG: hypothetical protein BWX49_01561 [Bacteroidetes bacterium ADurb.Bin008]HNV81875.1 hypothetical protein [Tenuifilaceae bacterium]
MINQSDLKRVLERIHEAEQLLKVGIEKGKLSSIERDILLEKFRAGYEIILFGGKDELSTRETQPSTAHRVVPIEVEKPIEKIVEKPVEKTVETKIPPVKPEIQHIATAPQEIHGPDKDLKPTIKAELKEEPVIVTEDLTVDEQEIEENGFQDKPKTPILGEKYQGKRKFRNETLGKSKKDIATKLQNKPINDLTKAIGINDKFLFTKELFNGNAELYAKTIVKLNEFTDINDALFYVQDHFNWDDKNEAANQLMELVRRKLLID